VSHVRCDPSQLEQVILNLAVNARDAMPRGGRLTLTTRPLPAGDPAALAYRDLPPGDYVQLAVNDSGGGIEPETLARLFEPFFTTKEVGKGTGLGLATVHGIIKQSGGSIRCESEPGKGTTFFLCLPKAEAVRRAISSPNLTVRRERGSEAILLVEDDPHVRRAAIRALESGGYRVRIAKDGMAALDIAAQEEGRLDLVVTDVVMPGLDGGALVEELKIRYPGLPALFVSGYPDEALSDHGVLREGVEFLPKPFSGGELLARVRKILDARS
jgi:CheY-like chemotaxis protein